MTKYKEVDFDQFASRKQKHNYYQAQSDKRLKELDIDDDMVDNEKSIREALFLLKIKL